MLDVLKASKRRETHVVLVRDARVRMSLNVIVWMALERRELEFEVWHILQYYKYGPRVGDGDWLIA